MKTLGCVIATATLLAMQGTDVCAGLIGTTVTVSSETSLTPDWPYPTGGMATVGAGIEFTDFAFKWEIDIGDTSIVIRPTGGQTYTGGFFQGLRFLDIRPSTPIDALTVRGSHRPNVSFNGSDGTYYINVDFDYTGHFDVGEFVQIDLYDTSPENPILPDGSGPPWELPPIVVIEGQVVYIDPEVAVGYDYEVSGPTIASVILPNIGDGLFDLYLWNGTEFAFDSIVNAGVEHSLGGVDRFRILGIETSAGVDPNDPTAFVTGLTFSADGTVDLRMTPISANVSEVPEPSSLVLLGIGMLVTAAGRSRRFRGLPTC